MYEAALEPVWLKKTQRDGQEMMFSFLGRLFLLV
jgi:hypothetical protein